MSKKWLGPVTYVEYTSTTGGTSSNVTYDATGGGSSVTSGTNTVTISWSHTTSTSTNSMVFVTLMVGGVSAAASTFTRTVTYGGNAMTSIAAKDGVSTNGWVEMFYLANPPTGAQTVSVTVAKASTTFGRVAANSFSYTNATTLGSNFPLASASAATQQIPNVSLGATGDSKLFSVFAVDSSTTITSLIHNNVMMPSNATIPNQGTTRWTSNSGATAGMTSMIVGEMPAAMHSRYNIFTAVAANYAGIILDIKSPKTAVPAGVNGCWVTMIGAGGAGGSGRRGLSTTARYGGDGGGGGATINERYISSAILGSSYAVYVPPIATGGAAQTTDNSNGNAGQRPLDVLFETGNSWTISAGSGHGGNGGSTAQSTYVVVGGLTGDGSGMGGYGGDGSSGAAAGTTADYTFWGNKVSGAAGGGGGGIAASGTAKNGGAGASNRMLGLAGGGGGVAGGANPGVGSAAIAGIAGSGAGGGASSTSTAAQAGASATAYGAGGGGGGASANSFASGAGGNGGPAYVRIMWDYR